ncbi:UDP-N-acetylmuramate dehydrogenase [Latilactobacillus graminis]|uniref:UDP-N-acetylenolpyruvoylglucosamine reductase n=2 Tax=Latilactobacillus graminis TaxID=60519 RepID=A0AA89HZZ5_9LACO|nr:UDP-N-acetylmuramate dehydrogenase [Latilactobacillus graminis]KRM21169.1 UDP-N-acetylenolpyruvoylglucosamine reductase [Latilactobacillus graminis DSM 20719]QFP79296.1 UDP-N-acetylmuramate dehydrogenase [Latilactobacillus graminis]
MISQIEIFLQANQTIETHQAEPLNRYTFTKTGGPADVLALPKSVEEVRQLVASANELNLPITIIGNASNLIVRDGGIEGVVIILTAMNIVQVEGQLVAAQAGAGIIQASEAAYSGSLTGLEFAAGIPGSVGGAVFMNAGAYGGEISDVLTRVDILTRDNQVQTLTTTELNFGYRHSLIQENGSIVLAAYFELATGVAPVIRERMDEVNALRAAKQPLEYPSCGSVFKRPVGYFVGPLIQKAGLQGYQIGGAQVSKKHAGFIVNIDHATATDYLTLIAYIQKTVWAKFNVQLEPEVRIIGRQQSN